MAATEFGTNDPQTVTLWSTYLTREAIGKMYLSRFMGSDQNSIIQLHTDLSKNRGDTINYDLLMQLNGAGVTGDTRLKGFEEPLVYEQDSLIIDQLRNAMLFRSMSQQRTVHNLRRNGQQVLSDWYATKLDTFMFSYLTGTTGDGLKSVEGELPFAGNPLTAPDADHLVTISGTMTLDVIDQLVERAQTIEPIIRPTRVNGEEKYCLVLTPFQVTGLRTSPTAVRSWTEVTSKGDTRGSANKLYTGALGEYNGVLLYESIYLPQFLTNYTDPASGFNSGAAGSMGVFLGAQAGSIAFGNAYRRLGRRTMGQGQYFSWFEDVDDYGNETGVAAGSIFGVKKNTWNALDYGTIALHTDDVAFV